MVNGNSKLKYFLLVQEEKKKANETTSTWFNYERLFDALGEGFSATVFGSVLPFQFS